MTHLPHIALITTGGTIAGAAASATEIAGYAVGGLGADALLAAVPQIGEIATIVTDQPFNIDSKDTTPAHWQQLAQRVQAMADAPNISGVVITHGTDTMEETATFLDLVVNTDKPVVMTGAMRPATALSADGPMNLLDAVRTAVHPDSAGRGVLFSFGETILRGFGLRKLYSDRIDAFAGIGGPIGRTRPDIRYFHPRFKTGPSCALPAQIPLPRVDIIHAAAGSTPALLHAAVAAGATGVVLALPGNGGMAESWEEAVRDAVAQGIPVMRASRCGLGGVHEGALDARTGSWPAGVLSPAAARVVLMVGLTTRDTTTDCDLKTFMHAAAMDMRTT